MCSEPSACVSGLRLASTIKRALAEDSQLRKLFKTKRGSFETHVYEFRRMCLSTSTDKMRSS
eukprot:8831185-Alexandrium_andersonii.AAC.1